MSVIKVKPWGPDQGDFVLIEQSDFNENHHKLYEEPKAKAEKPADKEPKAKAE